MEDELVTERVRRRRRRRREEGGKKLGEWKVILAADVEGL